MSGFKRFCLASLMLIMAVSLTAQGSLKLIQVDAADFPRVEAYLHAQGSTAASIDLSKAKFSVDLDKAYAGDSIRVIPAAKASGSKVLVCIDASGSVTVPQMSAIREALKFAMESVPSGAQVAVALFANEFEILQDFTSDSGKLLSAIAAIKNKPGNTYLHFNLNKAINHVRQAGGLGTRSVVLISDGKEEVKFDVVTTKDKEDMIATANRFGIPIHCLGYANDKAPDYTILDYFSQKTGGSFVPIRQKSDLSQGLQNMMGTGKDLYRLSFVITGLKGDGSNRTLNVTAQLGAEKYNDSKMVLIPANGKRHSGQSTPAGLWQSYRWYIIAAAVVLFLLGLYFIFRKRKQAPEPIPDTPSSSHQMPLETDIAPSEPAPVDIENTQFAGAGDDVATPEQQGEVRYQGRNDRTMILGPGMEVEPVTEEPVIEEAEPEPEPVFVGFTILKMEVMEGPDQGQIFTVHQTGALIGRSPDNDIVLTDGQCSRRHAIIEYADHFFSIRDLESGNGTYVNSVRITTRQIEHNDSFKIGANSGVFTLA